MTAYFVDNTLGLDTNDGLTSSTPFKTITKLNTLSAYTAVYFNGGERWRGPTLTVKSSGVSGARVLITTYGTGLATLDGSVALTNASFTLTEGDTYQIAFTPSTASCNAVWESGIKLALASSLANCKATAGTHWYAAGVMYVHSANAIPNPVLNGLVYDAANIGNVIDDNNKNYVEYSNLKIQRGYSVLSAMLVQGDNNYVHDCEFYHNSNHHVGISAGSSNLVEDCYGEDCSGGAFLVFGTCSGNTYRRVESVGTQVWTASAFQMHGGSTGSIIEDCTATQSVAQTSQVAAVSITDAGSTATVQMREVSGYWNGALSTGSTGGAGLEFYYSKIIATNFKLNANVIYLPTGATGVKIENNSVYNASTTNNVQFIQVAAGASAVLKNNAAQCPNFYATVVTGSLTGSNYNLWYGSTRVESSQFLVDGANTSLTQWKALWDANCLNVDPQWNDPASGDLTETATSPTIQAGVDVGRTADNRGSLLPDNVAPDIGCYQLYATASAGDARPVPVYGYMFRTYFPILKNDGTAIVTGTGSGYVSTDGGTSVAIVPVYGPANSYGWRTDLSATQMTGNLAFGYITSNAASALPMPFVIPIHRLNVLHSGTARVSGSPSSTQIQLATTASAQDNAYKGLDIGITAGTGDGQLRRCVSYVGSTRMATVNAAWGTLPYTNSTYEVGTTADVAMVGAWLGTVVPDPATAGVPSVNAITVTDKTGYSIVATGLDAIADPDDLTPATVPSTFTEKLRWHLQRFWKANKTPTSITVKNEAGVTITTQTITDDGSGTETLGGPT